MSKKNKMFCLRWNLLPRLIRICWIWWCCSRFETKISFLGIFGLKNLCAIWNFFWSGNTIFWANLVNQIKITCSRRNWLPRIWWQCSLFLLWTRNSLYGHNWSKKKSELYQILSNILNWMMELIFLFWTGNTIFWANFLHQIKRFYLTWNFVPRLIWICWIRWWFTFFLFQPEIPFLGKFVPSQKIKIVCLQLNLVPGVIHEHLF